MLNELLAFQQPTFFTSPGYEGTANHIGEPGDTGDHTKIYDGDGPPLPPLRRMGSAGGQGAAGAGLIVTSADPSGLPLDLSQVNAADAARTMIQTFGSDGQLSLQDIENAEGGQPDNAVSRTIAKDWSALAGGAGGTLSEAQLSAAIQTYVTAQRASDSQVWGLSGTGGFGPVA